MEDFKIKINYYDLEDNLAVESVWAVKEDNYYRIKNIPFFAPGIAYDDLVSIEEEDGDLYFDEIIKESGNSTLHVIIFDEANQKLVTDKFESMNCGWEGSHQKNYISVNVPKEVNYNIVKGYLHHGRETNLFDYKEACLADTHRNEN